MISPTSLIALITCASTPTACKTTCKTSATAIRTVAKNATRLINLLNFKFVFGLLIKSPSAYSIKIYVIFKTKYNYIRKTLSQKRPKFFRGLLENSLEAGTQNSKSAQSLDAQTRCSASEEVDPQAQTLCPFCHTHRPPQLGVQYILHEL